VINPDHGPDRPPRISRLLVTLAVIAFVTAFVVLHLTGVLGPSSH
jgi:hypothetical protein